MSLQFLFAAGPNLAKPDHFRKGHELTERPILLMNSGDPDLAELRTLLINIENDLTIAGVINKHRQLEELMQGILEREWEILKENVDYAERHGLPPVKYRGQRNPWWCYPPGRIPFIDIRPSEKGSLV